MKDLVSIITPMYNSQKYIAETMRSIQAQTYQHWEWIVVDDCSTDDSLDYLRKISADDPRIKVLRNEKNLKTALTRNHGIQAARGRYYSFIDSDDLWVPHKLERQISFMQFNDVALSYHSYRKFWGEMEILGAPIPIPEKVSYRDMLRTNSMACLSVMYDAHKLGKCYMPDGYKAREDLLCWLQILKKIDFAYGIPEALGFYRLFSGSYSANKKEMARIQWRLYRDHEKLPLMDAALTFAFYSLNGLLKKKII